MQTVGVGIYKYYVKTHSKGLKSGHSSAAQRLIPQELMVYKVLEDLGKGCESHFFGRGGRHLYIATLDANAEGKFKASGLVLVRFHYLIGFMNRMVLPKPILTN